MIYTQLLTIMEQCPADTTQLIARILFPTNGINLMTAEYPRLKPKMLSHKVPMFYSTEEEIDLDRKY